MRDSIREKLGNRKGVTTVEYVLLLVVLFAGIVIIWMIISNWTALERAPELQSLQGQEQAQESLVEKIKNASPEERPKLMVGASEHNLHMAGMDSHGSSLSGISGPWSDDEGNLYFFEFDFRTVARVWGPFAPSASSEVEPEKEAKVNVQEQ